LGMHQAATATKTPMIVSNNASLPIDKIAAAATGPLWFQLYPGGGTGGKIDQDFKTLEEAQAAGCKAVVMTVDQQASTYTRDLHNRNLGGRVRAAAAPTQSSPANPYRINRGRLWYTWDYLDTIHKFLKVPLLVKGILTAEDAEMCVQHGMAGIIVSNHGGRSMDYDPATLEVLPEIVNAVRGRILVLTDSGYRRGTDVLKALALGANAVCFGRATRWGLGAFGAAGAQRVLEILQAELVQAAAANGRSTLASIDKTLVRTNFP
jgi:4-hydroxymandelate oxidase